MSLSTIPYDPSLVLGQVIDPSKIKQLQELAEAQKKPDDAKAKMNALIRQKHSLDMTIRELSSIGATADQLAELNKAMVKLTTKIIAAAGEVASTVTTAEEKIANINNKQAQKQISISIQSPIDFKASQLEDMPIAADSMDMDVQFYRFEENKQSAEDHASSVSSYVSGKLAGFGSSYSAKAAGSVHKTTAATADSKELIGTLVICANCTHKNAKLFSPLKLDPDKVIENYVAAVGGEWDVTDVVSMLKLATAKVSQADEDGGLQLLAGASYGSSFVGMVFLTHKSKSTTSQSSQSTAASVRAAFEANLIFEAASGSVGLDAQASQNLKNLLSSDTIDAHCSLITMGVIPSIKSNQIKASIKEMKNDPAENMKQLAAMQAASDSSVQSLSKQAQAGKTGNGVASLNSNFIKDTVSAVTEADEKQNQIIDTNSLLIALEDFINKAIEGKCGVPINYYIQPVTKRTIALAWMKEYYPNLLNPKMKLPIDKIHEDQGATEPAGEPATAE